jgi:cobalt/nickel transport system permease protein
MIKETYLLVDRTAQKDNLITRIDSRLKLLLCVAVLGAIIAVGGYTLPLLIFTGSVITMFLLGIPSRLVLSRVLPPIMFGVVFVCMAVFLQHGEPLFQLDIAGFYVTGSWEGLILGTSVLARIAGSVSVLILLSFTTPIYKLGYALAWFKVPTVMVEIMLMTYRYVFVLWEEGGRIKDAQTLRLGYSSGNRLGRWKRTFKSTCTLMGMVFIRAYDRAESTYSAMQVRAYRGNIPNYSYNRQNSGN